MFYYNTINNKQQITCYRSRISQRQKMRNKCVIAEKTCMRRNAWLWGNGICVKVCFCVEGVKIVFNLTSVEQLLLFKIKNDIPVASEELDNNRWYCDLIKSCSFMKTRIGQTRSYVHTNSDPFLLADECDWTIWH